MLSISSDHADPGVPRRSALPSPLTSFVGRGHEAALALALLRRDDVRLLTLTGAGGVGKTRLAIKVAEDLAHAFSVDTRFVPLAPVQDAELVALTVARALGVLDAGHATVAGAVAAALDDAELLLVLDNFEHVLAAAPFVVDLLAGCPRLKILTTSRTLLRVSGEQALPVPPLDLPDPTSDQSAASLSQSAAVQLFVGRARAAAPDFQLTEETAPLVADICRHLDGLPLAIELAAAQSSVLPPVPLLARIKARLPLPFGGPSDAPVRLRSVRDTVAWSYDLLTTEQQRLFRRLGVFVGGFGLDAVEFVSRILDGTSQTDGLIPPSPSDPAEWDFDALATLVDRNLLRQEPWKHEPRFSMLETFRGFALEQLVRHGEEDEVRSAHADWCLSLAEASSLASMRPRDKQELRRLETEHANLRAALDWLERRGDYDRLLRLAAPLGRFWYALGHFEEGRRRLERALSDPDAAAPLARARALVALDLLRYIQGDRARDDLLAESIPVLREHGDTHQLVAALSWKGWTAVHYGEYDEAEAVLQEALAVAATIPDHLVATSAMGRVLANLGVVAHERGDVDVARERIEESLRIRRELDDVVGMIHSLCDAGEIAAAQARYAEALAFFRECLTMLKDQGYPLVAVNALVGSALVASVWGQAERAALLLGAAEAERRQFRLGVDLPTDRAARSQTEAAARAVLGDPGFQSAVMAGRDLPRTAAISLVQAIEPPATVHAPTGSPGVRLSPRELDVVRLLVEGRTDREIAEALFISVRTAEGHVARILAKLGVTTRSAAAVAAVAAGLASSRAVGSLSRA
ncbi:MAG TPA: tetratricopeptide repeat protein [Thermomicrobiales bacterium]|jgi:non-specific serine/threonine protein kinase|nr:tetratricopeptide repeat protein [Thermomicrobiales bacterium]